MNMSNLEIAIVRNTLVLLVCSLEDSIYKCANDIRTMLDDGAESTIVDKSLGCVAGGTLEIIKPDEFLSYDEFEEMLSDEYDVESNSYSDADMGL